MYKNISNIILLVSSVQDLDHPEIPPFKDAASYDVLFYNFSSVLLAIHTSIVLPELNPLFIYALVSESKIS